MSNLLTRSSQAGELAWFTTKAVVLAGTLYVAIRFFAIPLVVMFL